MSEGSLPPFKLRFLPSPLRRNLARLLKLFRRETTGEATTPGKRSSKESAKLTPSVENAIQAYSRDHAALFERATRLREKANRLEHEGTPSESARNRARRAEEEVEAGLRNLRSSFADDGSEERSFDREIARRFPHLKTSGE